MYYFRTRMSLVEYFLRRKGKATAQKIFLSLLRTYFMFFLGAGGY